MRRMVHGEWMRLGRVDPVSRAIELWTEEGFVPWRQLWPEFRETGDAPALPAVLDPRHDRPIEVYA
jgi:hypothetical protein